MAEPYCLAMVLCDAVHRDATTGKFTLLGTFSTVHAREFPAALSVFVYYAVTDGLGKTPLSIRIVDSEAALSAEAKEPVFESPPLEVDFSDPLMVMESVAIIQTQLPSPGLYHFELWAGDALLMSRRLLAMKLDESKESEA